MAETDEAVRSHRLWRYDLRAFWRYDLRAADDRAPTDKLDGLIGSGDDGARWRVERRGLERGKRPNRIFGLNQRSIRKGNNTYVQNTDVGESGEVRVVVSRASRKREMIPSTISTDSSGDRKLNLLISRRTWIDVSRVDAMKKIANIQLPNLLHVSMRLFLSRVVAALGLPPFRHVAT